MRVTANRVFSFEINSFRSCGSLKYVSSIALQRYRSIPMTLWMLTAKTALNVSRFCLFFAFDMYGSSFKLVGMNEPTEHSTLCVNACLVRLRSGSQARSEILKFPRNSKTGQFGRFSANAKRHANSSCSGCRCTWTLCPRETLIPPLKSKDLHAWRGISSVPSSRLSQANSPSQAMHQKAARRVGAAPSNLSLGK